MNTLLMPRLDSGPCVLYLVLGQLTYWPILATLPRWSPNGNEIAFIGTEAGKVWKVFVAPAQGGSPRELLPQDQQESDATWSPDWKFLAFGRPSYGVNLAETDLAAYQIAICDTATPSIDGL